MCRMCGGLGPHILIISVSLSLSLMRGVAVDRAPTILQNDLFYTRISKFFKSPILSATSLFVQDINIRLPPPQVEYSFSFLIPTNKQTNKPRD